MNDPSCWERGSPRAHKTDPMGNGSPRRDNTGTQILATFVAYHVNHGKLPNTRQQAECPTSSRPNAALGSAHAGSLAHWPHAPDVRTRPKSTALALAEPHSWPRSIASIAGTPLRQSIVLGKTLVTGTSWRPASTCAKIFGTAPARISQHYPHHRHFRSDYPVLADDRTACAGWLASCYWHVSIPLAAPVDCPL